MQVGPDTVIGWERTRLTPQSRKYWPFKKARAFARALGLKSQHKWQEYCKSGKKPAEIPATPSRKYANDGWTGYGDWLGTDAIAPQLRKYWPFKKARAFVHDLGLKSNAEWRDYCKSGKKPAEIPAAPWGTYSNVGWAGMSDWLGTGQQLRKYRPFKKARAFVRNLGLKSEHEWHEYTNSDKMPSDIPAKPKGKYAKDGWKGFGDWLGYARAQSDGASHPRPEKAFTS